MKRVEKSNSQSHKIDKMNERKTPEEYARKWDLLPEYDDEGFRGGNENKKDIAKYIEDFQAFYGRSLSSPDPTREHKKEYWVDQVDRCELDMVQPRVIYWTSKGRVTRIKITPPKNPKEMEKLHHWKVLVFHDYHQLMPSFYTANDFIVEEGSYIVCWYANWRKWPLKYKVWEFTANMTIVPFPLKECPTSIKKKKVYMEQNIPKLSVFHFHSWDRFDGEKNELERFDYIRGYFKNDPEMALSWSLERAKANWTYDQITHWNNGVMDHDGDIDFEKLQKIMYTPHIYGCAESNYNGENEEIGD